MAFFHQNPLGRIINRLTKDTSGDSAVVRPCLATQPQALHPCASHCLLAACVHRPCQTAEPLSNSAAHRMRITPVARDMKMYGCVLCPQTWTVS